MSHLVALKKEALSAKHQAAQRSSSSVQKKYGSDIDIESSPATLSGQQGGRRGVGDNVTWAKSIDQVEYQEASQSSSPRDATVGASGACNRRPSTGGSPRASTLGLAQGIAERPPHVVDNCTGLQALLWDKISILLLFYPFGIASAILGWGKSMTFWLNFMSMIPLAKIMGDATEELAAGLKSDTIGGLLNATFGNAVEMILTAVSLRHGLLEVVKATLLGSVLSNMLLVLGMSFLLGGLTPQNGTIKLKEQNFQAQGALVNMAMLLLACMSFALPTVFLNSTTGSLTDALVVDLKVSRACSALVLSSYFAYLIFQLYTHIKLFDDADAEEGDASSLTVPCATCLLAGATVLVSISSELLVNCIEGVVVECGLGEQFIGIILLPLIGNACEHAAAVRFAIQDRPALSIGIAVGSSTQIALLVVPFSVLVGWGIGQPMDLNFHPLNTCVLVLAVLIVLSIVSDGRAHWIEGYMLCIAYAIIAVLYWYVPAENGKFYDHSSHHPGGLGPSPAPAPRFSTLAPPIPE